MTFRCQCWTIAKARCSTNR